MVCAPDPAPLIWLFHAQAIPGSQPRRMKAPMSPVEMNVPVTNHRLTMTEEMANTMA